MPLYENQVGSIRDYWDIPTAMSPESFVRGAVSTPEESTFYSDARVLSSVEIIDLVTPDLIQSTPPNAACYAPKKKNNSFESSNNLNKKLSFDSNIIPRFYIFIFVSFDFYAVLTIMCAYFLSQFFFA